jgi:hypothetical protein
MPSGMGRSWSGSLDHRGSLWFSAWNLDQFFSKRSDLKRRLMKTNLKLFFPFFPLQTD